jgi:3-deoxy-D-manno-octulosonic-acid transferase
MADFAADIAYAGYCAAGIALMPVVPLFLSYRARHGKEDGSRLAERYGKTSLPRPPGRLVWVHAASVGETNTIIPVVQRIAEMGFPILFTSVTLTSARIAATKLPDRAIHQFSPLDIAPFITRFLAHWRPDVALFVESELWPTTITKLARAGVPQILVNARLSERSFEKWQRLGRVRQALFGRISLCLAQSREDGDRYRALGMQAVTVSGNLKFDVPPPAADPAAVASFRATIALRPVWVAASTHEGEEAAVAAAHRLLGNRHPRLLTIIVPRHPERGPAIAAALTAEGFRVARRGAGEAVAAETEIYLADTLNELGLFYRVAPIAFIGGSLIPHGGQNPIEAARLNTAVLHGPYIHNFAEAYAALDGSGQAERVNDSTSLAKVLGALLDDPIALEKRIGAAVAALSPFAGALEATMRALKPCLDRLALAPRQERAGEHAAP